MSHPFSHLCLASASPRRRELLASVGITPGHVIAADIDESVSAGEFPEHYVSRMAREKAGKVALGLSRNAQQCWVLGADTSVVVDQQVLGKPRDYADFCDMFTRLSGREHKVISAVALLGPQGRLYQRQSVSRVHFRKVTNAERDAYWQSGEPLDKAGGYAIQGHAAMFVEMLNGSYSGVVGLPLYETTTMLQEAGFSLWS